MERLTPETQMIEETDTLGISAHSFQCAMRAALTGEDMGCMEILVLPCVGNL